MQLSQLTLLSVFPALRSSETWTTSIAFVRNPPQSSESSQPSEGSFDDPWRKQQNEALLASVELATIRYLSTIRTMPFLTRIPWIPRRVSMVNESDLHFRSCGLLNFLCKFLRPVPVPARSRASSSQPAFFHACRRTNGLRAHFFCGHRMDACFGHETHVNEQFPFREFTLRSVVTL